MIFFSLRSSMRKTSRLQLWILDAGVIHGLQSVDEDHFRRSDIMEGDGAIGKESLCHLTVYQFVDQIADTLFRIFRQRTRGGLNSVAHHQYSLLASRWIGSWIAEWCFIDFLIRMFILVVDIEIFHQSCTMMGGYEFLDDFG